LAKEKVLVVGLGEVGRPLFELLRESKRFSVYGVDIDKEKMRVAGQSQNSLPQEMDILHVCVPFLSLDRFVDTTISYVEQFSPKLVIINSTVQPGTTIKVHRSCHGQLVAHSPIRGVHKSLEHMKQELSRWIKYIGGVDAASAQAASEHFVKAGFKTKILNSCIETELAKLFETTYRAWMIVCFQEMHRISRHFGADFDSITDFLEDTHRVRLDRPIMFPGVIGGHCLIPNVELLLENYDSELLQLVLKSNAKRKDELRDEDVMREVEKIENRAILLENLILSSAVSCKTSKEKESAL